MRFRPHLSTRNHRVSNSPSAAAASITATSATSSTTPVPEESTARRRHHHHHHPNEHRHHHQHHHNHHHEKQTVPPASPDAIALLWPLRLKNIGSKNLECVICSEDYELDCVVTTLPCGHFFHASCVVEWLCHRCTCPVCRYELPTEDPEFERGRKARMHDRVGFEEHVAGMFAMLPSSMDGKPTKFSSSPFSLSAFVSDDGSDCQDGITTSTHPKKFPNNFDLIMARTLRAQKILKRQQQRQQNPPPSLEESSDSASSDDDERGDDSSYNDFLACFE